MKVEKFEDLNIWQKARSLTNEIYRLTNNARFRKDFALSNHIRKTSVSVMSNIAEGFERATNREFSQYLFIAKGSLGEVRSQLYLALDLGYISKRNFDRIFEMTKLLSGMIINLIKYLDTSGVKGKKFKFSKKAEQ